MFCMEGERMFARGPGTSAVMYCGTLTSPASLESVGTSYIPDGLPADVVLRLLQSCKTALRKDIQEKNDTITELEGQLDILLGDQVAGKEKYESLEKRFTKLNYIAERPGDLRLKAELAQKFQDRGSQNIEYRDLIENIRRLKASLENYRSEEKRSNALVNKMELEYDEIVMKMNMEREQTVQELSNSLDFGLATGSGTME
ncbi:hypothetical protein LTR15_010381 [Elasticomyces elasticus]|nr:hypothetical protein LTR15_010381 [Elasticomyces elasticus]